MKDITWLGPQLQGLQEILNLTSQISYFLQTYVPVVLSLVLVLLGLQDPLTENGAHTREKISSPIVLQAKR